MEQITGHVKKSWENVNFQIVGVGTVLHMQVFVTLNITSF